MAQSITLQTSDNDIIASDVLGRLSFAASSESSGSDAILIGASIYAMAESDFTAISNATSIIFATSSSESAAAKLKISSQGHFLPMLNKTYDIGASGTKFRNVYGENGEFENLSIENLSDPYEILYITDGGGSVGATDLLKVDSSNGKLDLNGDIVGTGDINISGNLTANSGNFDVISFNVNDESPLLKGQLSWDDTEGTLSLGLTDNSTIHFGEHRYFRIRNETGGTLYKGQVVYASGVHANGIIVPALYVADGTIREVRFMGVVLENVNNQNNGYVVDFGHLENMDLDGSATNYAVGDETWSAGDILYVHPTVAGKLTKNEPKHSISVAIVLDPGNGNDNGRMFVRPTSYGHLDDNHDVNISGVTNGQFLQYNSSTDYWVPSSSGNFTTLQLNGTTVSVSGHTHVSSDITNFSSAVSGLLPTISNSGDNRILTSTGSSVGINAESNLTFDGNLLNVVGSGSFSSNLNLSSQTVNTIAGFDGSKNIVSLPTSTYPSFTELSYVKGVTSSIQTQLNSKAPTASPAFTGAATVTNDGNVVPLTVTNTGTANSFVVNDASGDTSPFVVAADGNVGIKRSAPSQSLHVFGNVQVAGTAYSDFSDFWAAETTAGSVFLPYGFLGSSGSFATSLYSNGYRNSSAAFTYMGVGGNASTACGIDLLPTGIFYIRTGEASGSQIPVRFSILADGVANFSNSVGIGVTADAPLDVMAISGNSRLQFTQISTNLPGIKSRNSGDTGYRNFAVDAFSHQFWIEGALGPSINNASQLLVTAGSASAPGVAFSGDTNTGMFSPGADQLAFSTNQTERMLIDANGVVSITSSLTGGQLIIRDTANNSTNKFGYVATTHYDTSEQPAACIGVSSQSAGTFVYVGGGVSQLNAATLILFYTASDNTTVAGTSRMTISSAAVTLAVPLLVTAGSASAPGVAISGDTNTGIAQIGGADTLSLVTAGSERVRVDASGRVGINSTTLGGGSGHIRFAGNVTGSTGSIFLLMTPTAQSDVTSTYTAVSVSPSTENAAFAPTNLNIYVASQGAITGGSRTTTTNLYGFRALSNLTGATNNYGFYGEVPAAAGRWNFYAAGGAANYFAGQVRIGSATDNGATYKLQVDSQIYATNATIATSDARFKTRVESLTDATSVIESLRPVAFDFIPQTDRNFATERQVGLIAQETQAALAGTDYADSVVAQCGDHLGLAYEKLVPVLIKALQESNARIDALEERLNHA